MKANLHFGTTIGLTLCLGMVALMLSSCGGDAALPKPRAFYRINYPERNYVTYDVGCPYTFERPDYSEVVSDIEGDEKYCWINLDYKPFDADLHISYKPIVQEGDFQHLINDAYAFVDEHNRMADGITEERISNSSMDAHGLLFKIEGNTASNLQFFLTDSTKHFFRASLYFNCEPNKDSLAPVVKFVSEDIDYLISSFRWTDVELEVFR